jgi:predicted nucleic acid-binding protein
VGGVKAQPYVDPSALLKLYIHEPESAAMDAWRRRNPEALTVTHHGRAEITNGICVAAFRKQITSAALTDTLASLEEDFHEGRYVQADLLWRATLERATELGREHTPTIGCRSLDVLHVASALELQFKKFLTFDLRQQKLARAVGLKVVIPSGGGSRP